ncbi:putative DNA repair protein XRCC3 -like protein [Capsicum annuum]|nr:putative DNA repair protein XRCC3 -like protein [Capsicum annuum]
MMTEEPTCHGLLGSNNWQGLLEPLNLNLRQLILRCGDFCQATYGAVNNDENSKYCCSNHYGKSSFFHKGMFNFVSDYKISSFLYATARGIYIAFRGTTRNYEWINVLGARPDSAESLLHSKDDKNGENNNHDDDNNVPKVMNRWLKIYACIDPNSSFTKLSTKKQLQTMIEDLRDQYKDENGV